MSTSNERPYPTPEEIAAAANILERSFDEKGFLPAPFFEVIAGNKVSGIVELVPFYETSKGTEVLLFKREPDDPVEAWQNAYHNPGANILKTDATKDPDAGDPLHGYGKALDRLVQRELKGAQIGEIVFAAPLLHAVERGPETSGVFWTTLNGIPKAGELYHVHNLPEKIIPSSKRIVNIAYQHYRSFK